MEKKGHALNFKLKNNRIQYFVITVHKVFLIEYSKINLESKRNGIQIKEIKDYHGDVTSRIAKFEDIPRAFEIYQNF